MTVPALDLDFAAGHDEAPAITCEGERLSYADLRRRAAAITARLGALGLRRGERFGALLANGPTSLPSTWPAREPASSACRCRGG